MDSAKAKQFYEEHKDKSGKDFRLEVLKLSKEDMYDFLENYFDGLIWEWRSLLHQTESKSKRLESENEKLKNENRIYKSKLIAGGVL